MNTWYQVERKVNNDLWLSITTQCPNLEGLAGVVKIWRDSNPKDELRTVRVTESKEVLWVHPVIDNVKG